MTIPLVPYPIIRHASQLVEVCAAQRDYLLLDVEVPVRPGIRK